MALGGESFLEQRWQAEGEGGETKSQGHGNRDKTRLAAIPRHGDALKAGSTATRPPGMDGPG